MLAILLSGLQRMVTTSANENRRDEQSPRQSTYYDTKIKRNTFVVSYRF